MLIAESTVPATVEPGTCRVLTGRWVSAYDGLVVTDPSALDIDHVVALEEAWDGGGYLWTEQQRRDYANDTTHPDALIAVSASSNRSKGSLTPDQWKPPMRSYWCTYATHWVAVKHRWDLPVSVPEKTALTDMLATCPT